MSDEDYMRLALRQAEDAAAVGEVPVGAVIVRQGVIIASDRNRREALHNPTAHAELLAITQAASILGNWRLEECALYVTLEPCPMCAGAIVLARVPRVVYGAADPKAGAARTLFRLLDDPRLNHRAEVVPGVLAEAAGGVLSDFFRQRRSGCQMRPKT
jgi:tRNA(adenine34) deaminase